MVLDYTLYKQVFVQLLMLVFNVMKAFYVSKQIFWRHGLTADSLVRDNGA